MDRSQKKGRPGEVITKFPDQEQTSTLLSHKTESLQEISKNVSILSQTKDINPFRFGDPQYFNTFANPSSKMNDLKASVVSRDKNSDFDGEINVQDIDD